ncbi:MAG: hypothetical protein Q9226_004637 [Calogaya cf. arnoldii]
MLENLDASSKYIQLESQHSRENVSAVDGSPQTPPSEPAKAAIAKGGTHTVKKCILHAAPIGMTIWILSYNHRTMYWRDAGFEGQNSILQSLQLLVKLHELLMGASLTEIVLHHTIYALCTSNGLPLGLVTAAHQISSPKYICSHEFLQAFCFGPGITSRLSRVLLLVLIVAVFLLTLLAAPSSAIAIIPRLEWWKHTSPYPEGYDPVFMRYKSSDLWPSSVTEDLIHPGCADTESADAEYCPYSGYEMVTEWVGAHQNQGQTPNLTATGHGGVTRHLASTHNDRKSAGWTMASTVGYREAWDLGAFWQYIVGQSRSLAQSGLPRIAPALADRALFIRKPVVQVECEAHYTWNSLALELPRQHLRRPDMQYENPWLIRASFLRSQSRFQELISDRTDEDQAYRRQFPTAFSWVDTSDIVNGPSIGAVFAVNTPNESVALVPCTIAAYWTPTSMFLDPKSDMVIQEESSDPLKDSVSWTRMTIASDWANAMNRNLTDNNGLETTYIQHMMELYNNNSSSPVIFSEPGYGQESIPWRISTALGLYLTEGLARVQSTFWNGTVLCHTDASNQEKVYKLGNLNADEPQWWPQDQNFGDYANDQGWTQLEFTVRRYGYGWGFGGTLTKAAAVVLVLQALLGLLHIAIIIYGDGMNSWSTNSWSTLGEMLALAINSRFSDRMWGTAAGIKNKRTWREPVKIREMKDEHLELVLDGGLPPGEETGSRLRRGRLYH